MAHAPILPILLLVVATRCKSDSHSGYHKANGASQFGNLLKPPPPPPLSNIVPVPFHGGAGRLQRQNIDVGYHYQPPPPPPPPPVPPSADFKFPAPFYKQYNFNFVPPPQPFSTTPSPSLFQKVSGWLFPSQQTGYDAGTNSLAPVKKDCNPCNLVPWIPVIRYNLGAKNVFPSSNPTYGPPSPTAYLDAHKAIDFKPQPFQSSQQNFPQLSPGIPHAVYGPPALSHFSNSISIPSSTYGPPVSTYGPPSPTHTVSFQAPNSLSSPYYSSSTSYSAPSTSYSAPSSSYSVPSSSYGVPNTSIRHPSSPYSISSSSQGLSSTSYSISSSTYATPSPSYGSPVTTTYASVTPLYEPEILNNQLPHQNDVDIFKHPSEELQLPKVTPPTTFKNSYGEPISNSYISDVPYPVSATAAESMKIKTEVLPNSTNLVTPNVSLANPAPFTLNRGRNIHTLQPVALPNLSVSPLPPIFNARPFRPTQPNYSPNLVQGINSMQQNSNNVKIEQSVPVVDFTHSVDYPASFVQSPIIDIESTKTHNQTKAYRNIPNAFILNDLRDISYQASEDHVAATKTLPDSSFESTGADFGNELYDAGTPMGFKQASISNNHKNKFADLRGVRDEYVDKYRTESNLQNIDSPILYLKPSAPHKEYGNFVLAISTPTNDKDYEIYDEIPTTVGPQLSTPSSAWDDSRNDYNEGGQPPTAAQESIDRPKIVQIIVPYTSGHNQEDWEYTQEKEYQGRKIPSNTENTIGNTVTHGYNTPSTTTEDPNQVMTDNYDSERLNTAAILNDLYDVKEPPFDIIKLQHTIDDWTEQEYSEHYKTPQRTRGFGKYAKQIPDDYFTTTMPTNYVTATNNYNYDYEDHEGSSSINHPVTNERGDASKKPKKEYNIISRDKTRHSSSKNEEEQEVQKLHIYTAASTFRSTTTTPAPWGKILTSISPLTKEKVYVVTSKPWREARNVTNDWYEVQPFESKRATIENDVSGSDTLPFKSPRFVNRPSLGFTSSAENDSVKSDSSFGFSQSWYQSINDLENKAATSNLSWPEGSPQKHTTNLDEDSADITTADLHSNPET